MATLDWHVSGGSGVTLVRLLVTSDAAERVRIESCLDGPVWPPRRQGVPEEGWDEGGFEGVVDAGGRLVLGYATPADPAEPPARIVSAEPVGDGDPEGSVSARDVIRTLGDPTPPRDAVPREGDATRTGPTERATGEGRPEHAGEAESHAAIDAWLDGVRERVNSAERLARASSVSEASEAVDAVGGPGRVADLRSQLDADRERLERLAAEGERLAARIEGVEVPVETLQQLA